MVANSQLSRNPFKATSEILNAAKATLKAVMPKPDNSDNALEVALYAV